MVHGDVERFEVVPVVLDLGPFLDREARVAEQHLDATPRARDGVQAAGLLAPARLRDVDPARREPALEFGPVELCLACLDQRREFVAHGVDARAGGLAFVGRECAERLQLRRDRAFPAEELDLERLEVHKARARVDARPRVAREVVEPGLCRRFAHRVAVRLRFQETKRPERSRVPALRGLSPISSGNWGLSPLSRPLGGEGDVPYWGQSLIPNRN
jgi:hypothetical protein